MNKAESILSYYESDDFKSNYVPLLLEDLDNNKREILNKLQNIIKYDLDFNDIAENKYLSIDELKPIYDLIVKYAENNLETLIEDFSSYYVGDSCLCSVSFGEVEEQIEDNEKQMFDDAGFCINRDFAYYDMSSQGIMIDFYSFFKIDDSKQDFLNLL